MDADRIEFSILPQFGSCFKGKICVEIKSFLTATKKALQMKTSYNTRTKQKI